MKVNLSDEMYFFEIEGSKLEKRSRFADFPPNE